MRRIGVGAALGALAVAVLGCSGSTTFPEEAACASTTPLPTSTVSPGNPQNRAYFATLNAGSNRLQQFADEFRARYPSGRFSRDAQFRTDFAAYSDNTRCTASALQAIAPSPQFEAFDSTLDQALAGLIAHTEFGREAVRKRNTSEFRAWRDGLDAKLEAVRAAVNAPRP